MTDHRPIRIAITGLGGHSLFIQNAIEASGRYDVAAVFDPNPETARAAGERFGAAIAPTYEAMLDTDGLEAMVEVTPNFVHRVQTEQAFERGLHVFVEKPIANTVEDGRAMIEAAERADRILMTGHNMRYGRAARRAKQLIDDGRLGTLVSFEIHFSADNTKRIAKTAWRLDPERCPLLPVMQLGIHGFDLVDYLAGPIRRTHAYARSVTTPIGVTDAVSATFETDQDVLGTMVSTYCTPVAFEYRIAGTEGTLRCTPHRTWFRTAGETDGHGEGRAEVDDDYLHLDTESYTRQMHHFADCIRRGDTPETDGWTGLRNLAVVEAMAESVATGRPVDVTVSPAEGQTVPGAG